MDVDTIDQDTPLRFGLLAHEWLSLAALGEGSEVAPCCGNIGELRDALNALATNQDPDRVGMARMAAQQVARAYSWSRGGHNLNDTVQFPLLARIVDGIRADFDIDADAMAADFEHDAERRYGSSD